MAGGRVRVGPQHWLTPLGVFEGSQWRVRAAQPGSPGLLEGQRVLFCPIFTPKNTFFRRAMSGAMFEKDGAWAMCDLGWSVSGHY